MVRVEVLVVPAGVVAPAQGLAVDTEVALQVATQFYPFLLISKFQLDDLTLCCIALQSHHLIFHFQAKSECSKSALGGLSC